MTMPVSETPRATIETLTPAEQELLSTSPAMDSFLHNELVTIRLPLFDVALICQALEDLALKSDETFAPYVENRVEDCRLILAHRINRNLHDLLALARRQAVAEALQG